MYRCFLVKFTNLFETNFLQDTWLTALDNLNNEYVVSRFRCFPDKRKHLSDLGGKATGKI